LNGFAIADKLKFRVGQHPRSQQGFSVRCGQVVTAPAPRVIAVGMRDHGTLDRRGGINEEVTRRAIQASGCRLQK
jgi:hypothetical protein